jgi:hypothetical protein
MAASSHPCRGVQETEREVTSRSQAGRSRHTGGHSGHDSRDCYVAPALGRDGLDTAASGGVEATLVTARRLLNNPPTVHASPSAAEQWRHDGDHLVVAAINTPHHEGGRQEPVAAHSRSPSAARAPPSARVSH